jgi:glycosyltransferase involved in cell wall biosynthesis
LRIAHVITGTGLGGAERMLHKVGIRLARRGHEQLVVSLAPVGAVGRDMIEDGLPVLSLSARPRANSLARLLLLPGVLRRFQPQVLQSWMYHADLMTTLAQPFVGVPHAWNVRGSTRDFGDYRASTAAVVRWCAGLSSRPQVVVVNSEAGRRAHEGFGYAPRRWLLLPNGFDVATFRPDPTAHARLRAELALPTTARLIAVVARFHPMKDHNNFLAALARLAPRRPQLLALLIGPGVDGANTELRELIVGHGLGDRVRLVGVRRDVEDLLPGLDLLCLPSASGEGFPNVVGEAMACGVPCAVTDVGDSGAMVGETGRTVPPRDPTALAAALAELLDEGTEAHRRRRAACRARIEAHFSIDAIAERYEALYRQMVGEER